MLRKGEWVWVDSDIGVPIGARVKVTPSGQQLLVDDEGKERCLSPEQEASIRIMHPTSVEGVDDMITLGDMTEAGLLRNLLLRHKQGIIYTYTGSVLVAVNPYRDYPIYSKEQVRLYHGRKLGELPPHIFAIAESCYFNMTRHLRNQCCIISGESGAGKTESTKLILQYLAAVSGELSEQHIEQQILESNPILEAFGNAKTIRNDNSSRFGKYLEIFYNKDGMIEGARVEQYLLEKSRVCHQAQEERNYHIFYCMLAGITAKEKKTLSLGTAKDYTFLTRGDCIVCEGRDDANDYSRVHSAMKILTFTENQCQDILELLAAILHLGNVCFEATTQNNLETCDVSKSEHFSIAASLLQVQKSSLDSSLTHRSFMTNRERVTKPLSSEQASDSRDAFVKAIYNKLFIWIVGKINSVIYKALLSNRPKATYLSIGLLDIFGFENFNTNSFEQLCINFANEKLQQFFVAHIFKLEQKEYQKEGVRWENIHFSDNQNILDLLAGTPCNLLALIDEESHFPKGSDVTLLNKINQQHRGNKTYICSKSEHDADFGICHFAGVVYYDSKGFLEKNRDAVSFDVIKMVDMSTNKLLRQIFEAELSNNGVKITNNRKVIVMSRSSLRPPTDNRKQVPTLTGQFRQSLDSLMKALSACQPFFIRCFKPNNGKQSEVFDRELCMRQLRYSGMMDTIRIRKLGYPIRHTFEEFLHRYRVLLKTTVCDPKTTPAACCEAICNTVIQGRHEWKIGRTKIFLKDAHDAVLERLREEELSRVAVVIQRVMLGHKDRKSFLRKRRATVVLQKHWRAHRERREHRQIRHGFERLASKVRGRNLRSQYQRQRAAALTIQAQVRGYRVRKDYKKKREAALLLEAQRAAQEERNDPSPPYIHHLEDDNQDLSGWEIQRCLEEVVAQEAASITEQNSEEDMRDETPPVEVIEHQTSEFEMTRITPEPEVTTITPARSSPTPSTEEEEDEFYDDTEEFSFYKFSQHHFQDNATHTHINQRLKKPLLPHDDEGDALACLTISWIILRFMGDIPEPKSTDSTSQASSTIAHPLPHRQGRRLSNLVGLDQKMLRKNKKKFGGNRKASTIMEEPEDMTEDRNILIGEGPTLYRPLTPLEKLHIIVGYALLRRDIRDEIYCQICKQLVNNNNGRSRTQGWILLSICLGIFPPTDLFMKYLENFVRQGPRGYREYCVNLLRRIKENGERKELPCWIELQAARSREPIDVSVTLMDGRAISLHLDSASTSAEVCQAVADDVGLKDTFGFSLYISLYDKMWSLSNSEKHVLDAVSQCEQEVRRQGREEKDASWRLSIRKEFFLPWHDCSADPVSTDLIYRQVIKGIKSGEYTSEKEDEYVQLAAKHYYIRFGSVNNKQNVQKVVEESIATTLIESKSMTKWIQLISDALSKNPYDESSEAVKGHLVDSARQKWPLEFSKFYDVTMMSGPPLTKSRFVVAVNWSGVFFMDGRDKKLLEMSYIELKKLEMMKDSPNCVNISTLRGDFVLKSEETVDMAALIEKNMEGLRQRSVYALAKYDVNKSVGSTYLACKRGELLQVEDKEHSPDKKLFRATNQNTNGSGVVSKEALLFLPTLTKPSDEVMALLNPSQKKISLALNKTQEEETVAAVSLKEFALENFRPAGKEVGRQAGSKKVSKEKLWACTKEPLKQPLMKTLMRNSDLSYLACNAFTAILKYMGDYPIKHARSAIELTDQIFGPATQHEALRDEIYCQIMRQMTSNTNRLSVERGWQLMWLCTGLFPPSHDLKKHAVRFLESRRRDALAADCLQRLQEIGSKLPRKLPPHLAEVDAIQQNSTNIFHKVHFPNDTNDIFEVKSTTTVKELCCSIASQLSLSSAEGYGLYMKIPNKIVSLDERKYFFDTLRQPSDAPKKPKRVKEANQANMPCLVIYKRKLWFNVNPGKDQIADRTFHFPQELPKYLRGYHTCTKEDMVNIGGLLFRVQVDSDRSQFVMIPKMLNDLVPADQLNIMTPDEWKKHIISSYNKQSGITVEEAKTDFLRAISSWPTFGCAFFEVKQTCDSDYPSILSIAVSKQGVSLIDPKTKEMLVMHPFSRIIEYHSKGNFFQMTIGTLVRGYNFVCETSQAFTIEDLLRSYVNMYEEQKQAFRPKNHMFT